MAHKTKQIIKRDANTLAKPKNASLMRDFISTHPILHTAGALMERMTEMVATSEKELPREFFDDFKEATFALGLSTHVPVAETVRDEYKTFLAEMTRDIEREYNCTTASEKALAEAIASSYVRTIQYSRALTECTKEHTLSHEINGHYAMVSKELDRAHRHFTNALLTLVQLKSPKLELNIKAKNAFIAQNQQFNTSSGHDENNDQQ